MDRTLISFNLPNLITITLMAAVGYLAVALLYQLVTQGFGAGRAQSGETGAGY